VTTESNSVSGGVPGDVPGGPPGGPPGGIPGALAKLVARAVGQAGGWIPFDRFMALVLYAPGLGYYANATRKFGMLPASGSDFVTAPELSPLFGRALAVQVADALRATGTTEIWEFGAGSGALAAQLLASLGDLGVRLDRYTIVDLSGDLRARQQALLAPHGGKVVWADALPDALQGVVVGNEVLDAMPARLLARTGGVWHERGVAWDGGRPVSADRPTGLRPPVEVEGAHDYVTEIHPQADAFMRTLADRLERGAALLLDYGFPESEYYHPQRHMGTLMCHQGHRAGGDPLQDLGLKDITVHVNFTGIALAAQEAGLPTLGYTSQARLLLNCGIAGMLADAAVPERAHAMRLVNEHEMGELFKAIILSRTPGWTPLGFATGDRTHSL